jgi:chromosome segregation ATPase
VQVKADLVSAKAGLQKCQQDARESAAKAASTSASSKSLATELERRDQQIADLKVALDTEAMSVQQLNGTLDARGEEVFSLQSQLQAAQDMARRLQDQVSQADSDIRRLQVEAASASESRAVAQRDADGLRSHSQSLSSRLEDSESRLAMMQESLDKRQQEVRIFKLCIN